ncbi:phage tail protein [Burkholderia ubonensis]|uniref:Phage tail protein n=2 Tax=Burkholderia ubonensis TaxID=101571 RepID=A0A103QSW3_9BURK|nr:phage tail protein [Burkholderia ubonensis]KVG54969.1 phage tail protein [Burkholderia ubonensis]
MSVSAASASATLTADEIIVETALGGIRYCLPAFNQTINLATTGAGGMDTGTAPTSGFVALYAIYNPTTKAAALLATNATSAVAPAIYGGANMPVGFTASALVSVWATNASRQLVVASQIDREVFVVPQTAFQTSTQQSSSTPLSISALVPPNAKSVSGNLILGSSSASASLSAQIAANAGSFGGQQLTGFTGLANLAVTVPFRQVPLLISQTIYYACVVNVGTASFTISLTSYTL